jgi:hypothetical protein
MFYSITKKIRYDIQRFSARAIAAGASSITPFRFYAKNAWSYTPTSPNAFKT